MKIDVEGSDRLVCRVQLRPWPRIRSDASGFSGITAHRWRWARAALLLFSESLATGCTGHLMMAACIHSVIPLSSRTSSLARRLTRHVFLRYLSSRVDYFLSIGTLNTLYLEDYGVRQSRITVAAYAVDNDHFLQGSAAERANPALARRQLGNSTDGVVFVASGKLALRKRPLNLLHDFARSEARTTSTLVYAGDGILRNKVEEAAHYLRLGQRVVVLGFRNQLGPPAIYGGGDALVLPSGGMAAGLAPVVSNPVAAGPDLVPSDWLYPS